MAHIIHMSTKLITYCTLFLLLLFIHKTSGSIANNGSVMIPVGEIEYKMVMEMYDGGRRRKLGPFQVCLVCRCCVMATDPTTCSNIPCCFGIDCQLPNKPFGVCAFVPKTCNCTTCASPH